MINQLPTVQSPLQYLLHAPFAFLLCLEIILSLYDGLWQKHHLFIKTATVVVYTLMLVYVAVSFIRQYRLGRHAAAEMGHSRRETELIQRPEPLTYKYVINERTRGPRMQTIRTSQVRNPKPGSSSRKQLQPSRKFSSFGLMSEVET